MIISILSKSNSFYFYFHDWRYFIFLLFLNWLKSTSYFGVAFFYAKLCLTNFLNYLIFSSFTLYYFYFSFNISNFFSYNNFFWLYSISMDLTFYYQIFSVSLLYCSNSAIYYSNFTIISGVTVCIGFLFLDFYLYCASFYSNYLIFYCFFINC